MRARLFGLDDKIHADGELGAGSGTPGSLMRDGRFYIFVGLRASVAEYREIPFPRDVTGVL